MPQVCASNPLPSFSSLYGQLQDQLTFPPAGFSMPSLPSLPSPMFPTMQMPNFEAVTALGELQTQQFMATCKGMIDPLIGTVGGIIPSVPNLNLKLPDLLAGNPSDLYQQVQDKIAQGVTFPGIPQPLFPDISIPQFESVTTVTMLIKQYLMSLPDFIYGLVGQVTSFFHLPGMPAIPSIPSLDSLKGMILAQAPGVPSFDDLMKKLPSLPSMDSLFNFSIPGFPAIPSLPDPLFPSIEFPQFEFMMKLQNMMDSLSQYNLQSLMDFCNNTISSKLPFSFPCLCATFPDAPTT